MGSNGDLNANSECLGSTGDLILDKAISLWITWDKVRLKLVRLGMPMSAGSHEVCVHFHRNARMFVTTSSNSHLRNNGAFVWA